MLEELQQRNYAKTTVHDDIVSVERRAVPTPVRMNAARSATAPMVTQPFPAHWAEVMQETYLAVWRAAGAFAGASAGGTAVGWLWTIAARRLVDAFRRRAHHAEPPPAAALQTTAPAAEEEALAETVGGDVGDALRCLAPELRQVLQAMVLDGLSVRETAVLLGLPEGTVKTRARRARIAMRRALT